MVSGHSSAGAEDAVYAGVYIKDRPRLQVEAGASWEDHCGARAGLRSLREQVQVRGTAQLPATGGTASGCGVSWTWWEKHGSARREMWRGWLGKGVSGAPGGDSMSEVLGLAPATPSVLTWFSAQRIPGHISWNCSGHVSWTQSYSPLSLMP
jgi:hypothetical protein